MVRFGAEDLITAGELAKWTVVRRWGQDRRRRLQACTAGGPVIPYDTEIAQLRGRPRPQNDTWIAACCLRSQVPLVTVNAADFADLVGQHGLAPAR